MKGYASMRMLERLSALGPSMILAKAKRETYLSYQFSL
jgi:hypothetical protein